MKSILFAFVFLVVGCKLSTNKSAALKANVPTQTVGGQFYLEKVEPVLNSRCVACHACYDSPCGINLASPDGILRGITKAENYALRLNEAKLTRLFVDAENSNEWRKLGFHSIIGDKNNKYIHKTSLLAAVIEQDKRQIKKDKYDSMLSRTCPTQIDRNLKIEGIVLDRSSLLGETVVRTKPYLAMPYGLPKLRADQSQDILTWLEVYNAEIPVVNKESIYDVAKIKKWEEFFNNIPTDVSEFKHKLTMKYLYEHLFIGHINFHSESEKHEVSSSEYYRLVRSSTSEGPVVEIPSRRPTDKISEEYFYRFKKLTSTIVNKTHIVYRLVDSKLERYRKLFLDTSWVKNQGKFLGYEGSEDIYGDKKIYTNPYASFAPIPSVSRFQFMLDDAEFFIRTFIRGPVCRGQIALSVINDHFWIFFMKPMQDIAAVHETFLYDNRGALKLPNAQGLGSNFADVMFSTYRTGINRFWTERNKLYSPINQKGLPVNAVWDGDRSNANALLTVYRHADSSTVVRGLSGAVPKTAWVVDYQTLESIYYNLVASFDMYSPVAHQVNARFYMDTSRISSEDMFLNLFPVEKRLVARHRWSHDQGIMLDATIAHKNYPFQSLGNVKIVPASFSKMISAEENKDLIREVAMKITGNFTEEVMTPGFDAQNCPLCINSAEELKGFGKIGAKYISRLKGRRISKLPEMSIVRVTGGNTAQWFTMVKNVSHYNVATLIAENLRENPEGHELEIHRGFLGSYPNAFYSIKAGEEQEFFESLLNNSDANNNKFVVGRFSSEFWGFYDGANRANKELNGHSVGVFDLGRYMNIYN